MLGKIPESFDELGKGAETHIKKIWNALEAADVEKFKDITNTAIRYQDVIRNLQRDKQREDTNDLEKKLSDIALLNTINQNIL